MLRRGLHSALSAGTDAAVAARSMTTAAVSLAGTNARVCAVMGGQWGDEGKGKLADVLAKNYDVVARFNGGANAGHTVVVDGKKFAFHLLPCGLVYPHTVNLLGNGVVVDLDALFEELAPLNDEGIDWRGRLFLSDRAHLLFGFHRKADGVLEMARAAGSGMAIGTTKKGIGPAYAAKATRTPAIRVGALRNWDAFVAKYRAAVDDHSRMYGIDYSREMPEELERIRARLPDILPMIVDGVHFINDHYSAGRRIITEGANACMLDIDFGTFPFVTSSSTTAGGICTGLGLSPDKVDCVMGVFKAYTTRVGGGPFPTELTDERGGGDRPLHAPGTDIGLHLQTVGAEVGVTTGRKRRCGWFDAVVARYSHMLNNYKGINLTKLDVLDDLDEVRIGVAYSLNGETLPAGSMPADLEDLAAVEVEYVTLPGWKTSTQDCRTFEELPENAQTYIRTLEEHIGAPISWVGVGPGREAMIQVAE